MFVLSVYSNMRALQLEQMGAVDPDEPGDVAEAEGGVTPRLEAAPPPAAGKPRDEPRILSGGGQRTRPYVAA